MRLVYLFISKDTRLATAAEPGAPEPEAGGGAETLPHQGAKATVFS